MKLKHIKELDGIRAIAALMVMLFHFSGQIPATNAFNQLFRKIAPYGQTGVTLFFVLSGFLITRILLSTKENNNFFKTFYLRRALRIFPLYYLYLIIELIIVPSISKGPTIESNTWYFWFYLQNFAFTFDWPANGPNHYWSLAVEEHFYLFWPFLVYFLNEKNIKKLCISFILLSLLIRVMLMMNGYGGFYFTFTNIDSLAIGGLMALFEREGKISGVTKVYFAGFVVLFIPLGIINWFVSGKGLDIVQLFKTPITALAYFFLILFAINTKKGRAINSFLTGKPLTFLGKISYGLYVFHPLCFTYCATYINLNNWVLNLLLQTSITIVVAALSFNFFESLFLNLKSKFEYKNSNTAPVPAGKLSLVQSREVGIESNK
ncbi:MAG: acyltransferase [Flavobacterium sp.]|nr:MAG: acyltransferase [Flavobacterium sp.]